MRKIQMFVGTIAALTLIHSPVHAQVVGTYDNFDCFNDTDQETEGFEIDIEDVNCPDDTEGSTTCNLSRVFPSNFSSTPWVIRYGLPTITTYDFTTATADPAHAYDQGHAGVLVTYAATWNGTQWVVPQPTSPYGSAGNGTPYNKNPTITAGDSCWWYGLGAKYPTSGCDHFGISFATGVSPGKIAYHWKVPDPANAGQLINWSTETSLPPSPTFSAAGGAVQAVAQAPDNEDPVYAGPAYFVQTTTIYSPQPPDLAGLQVVDLKKVKTKKYVTYSVVQQPPAGGGGAGEKEDVENDNVPAGNVQVTKQYQYYAFGGVYDPESHEATCDTAYKTYADALANTNPIASGDSCSIVGNYWVINPYSNVPNYVKSNKGKYMGAHVNAVQVQ